VSKKRERPFRHAMIREEHMLLLDGDTIGCIVLNQMIEWQRTADTREQTDSGWFYKSTRQLAEADLFEAWTRRTIKRRLDDLVERGYLHKREVEGAHKANEWRVDIDALNRDLSEYGAKVRGYPSDYLVQSAQGGGADSMGPVHSAQGGGAERTGPPNARDTEYTSTEDTSEDTSSSERDDGSAQPPDNPPPEARRSDPDAQSELRQQAESVGLEVGGREPIDERDGDTRLGVQQIQQKARSDLGEYWNAMSGGMWMKRLKAVSHFFSKDEIDEAMQATLEGADSGSWAYFRACLNNCDEPDPTDGRTTGKAKRDKLRDRYGLGGGAS